VRLLFDLLTSGSGPNPLLTVPCARKRDAATTLPVLLNPGTRSLAEVRRLAPGAVATQLARMEPSTFGIAEVVAAIAFGSPPSDRTVDAAAETVGLWISESRRRCG
jgi:hypothetical protein